MPSSLPTQTDILHAAISLTGSTERPTSIDDSTSNIAKRAKTHWDILRRMLLARHPWNFAIERATLNVSGSAPGFGWERKYQLPAGCVRWLPAGEDSEHWFAGEEEGGFILTDAETPICIRFISDHTLISKWSPGFVQAMTRLLAEAIGLGITESVGIQDRLAEAADRAVREGKRIDGLSTGRRKRGGGVVIRSDWLGARSGAYRWRGR